MELFYYKKSGLWVCHDRFGNKATGATKDLARNAFYLKYEFDSSPKSHSFDMTDIIRDSMKGNSNG